MVATDAGGEGTRKVVGTGAQAEGLGNAFNTPARPSRAADLVINTCVLIMGVVGVLG